MSLKPQKRHMARRFVIFLIIGGVLSFIANLVIDNPYMHRLVRIAINERMQENTRMQVAFNALKVTAVPPGADLYNLRVHSIDLPEHALFSASQVRARISIWALFLGEIGLAKLEVNGLQLTLPLPEQIGPFFIEEETETGSLPEEPRFEWPPQFELPIDEIVLRNASIYYELRDQEIADDKNLLFAISLDGFNLTLINGGWQDLRANVNISSLSLAVDNNEILQHSKLKMSSRINRQSFRSSDLFLQSNDLDLSGALLARLDQSAASESLDHVLLNFAGHAAGDLTLLGRALSIENTKGPVEADLKMDLTLPLSPDSPKKLRLDLTGEAKTKDAYISNFKLLDSRTKIAIDLKEIRFEEAVVRNNDQTYAKVNGKIGFGNGVPFSFNVLPSQLPLSGLLSVFDVDFSVLDFDLSGQKVEITGRGTPFNLDVSGQSTARNFTFENLATYHGEAPTCDLNFRLKANINQLNFDGSRADCLTPPSNDFSLNFKGFTSFATARGMNLEIASTALPLPAAKYFTGLDASGKVAVTTKIHGPYDRIRVDTSISGTNLSLQGIEAESLVGQVDLLDDQLTLRDFIVRPTAQSEFQLNNFQIQLTDRLPFKTDFLASAIPSKTTLQILNALGSEEELHFGVSVLKGGLSGDFRRPFGYQGRLSFVASHGRWQEMVLFDKFSANLAGTKEGLQVESVKVDLDDLQLVLQASHKKVERSAQTPRSTLLTQLDHLGLQANDFLELKLTSSHLAKGSGTDQLGTGHLSQLPFVGGYLSAAGLNGRLSINSSLKGSLENLQGTIQADVNQLKVLNSPMAPLNVKGFVENSKFDLLINHSGNALAGRLTFDFLRDNIPYEMYLHANRLDVRPLGTAFFFDDPRNYAYITSSLNLKGEFGNWWASQGNFAIDDFRIFFVRDASGNVRSLSVHQQEPLKGRIGGNRWEFLDDKKLTLRGERMILNLATRNNTPPHRLGLEFEGELDVGVASYLSTEVESASGRVIFKGGVKGSVTKPEFMLQLTDSKPSAFASVDWEPVSLGLVDLRPPMENINLDISYQNSQLSINQFTADKGTGSLSARGLLDFANSDNPDSRIDIDLNAVTIVYPVPVFKSIEALVTGQVAVSGSRIPIKIDGELQIERARSTGDFDLRQEIVSTLRRRTYATKLSQSDALAELNLRIFADNSIAVNNRNIQATLSSNFNITGTDARPIVTGQVEINNGKFIYKRDFDITQGSLTFDDPTQLDPKIDILAASEISSYRVFVAITGRASEPVVDLSIEPATREDNSPITKLDIITLMSSGQLPDSRSNITDTRAVAQTEALNLFGGFLEEPVEKLFDLAGPNVVRQVYIDAHTNEEGTPMARLNMPLNLGTNWEMIFRVDQESWKVSSEYSLHDNISVLGGFDGKSEDDATGTTRSAPADTGVDLRFRFSFP